MRAPSRRHPLGIYGQILCCAEELGIEFYVQDRPLVFACRLAKPRTLLGPLGDIGRESARTFILLWDDVGPESLYIWVTPGCLSTTRVVFQVWMLLHINARSCKHLVLDGNEFALE